MASWIFFFLFLIFRVIIIISGGSAVKNPPAKVGDAGSIPGLGRSPGGGHGNPLQCSCLENPMDRGAWQATVHGVTQSQIRPKQLSSSITRLFCVFGMTVMCSRKRGHTRGSGSRTCVVLMGPRYRKLSRWSRARWGSLRIVRRQQEQRENQDQSLSGCAQERQDRGNSLQLAAAA